MSAPLPRLSWPPAPAPARFHARAFPGTAQDLDIAFGSATRPSLVTALLCACLHAQGKPLSPELAWRWTAAERLQGLLAIAACSLGPAIAALATCTDAGCGERFELELGLAGFAGDSPPEIQWRAPDGVSLRIALPSGELQQAWHDAGGIDEHWLARRLVLQVGDTVPAADWPLPASWLPGLARALDAADPLTALSLAVACPCCGRAMDLEVDIEQLLLDGLRRRQWAWLDEVHVLASAYHWHEAQIVDLPAWRRQHYLQRLLVQTP